MNFKTTARLRALLPLPLLMLSVSLHAASGQQPGKTWDRIDIAGDQIGYATTQVSAVNDELLTEEEVHLDFKFGGKRQQLHLRTLWVETGDGRPLRWLRSVHGDAARLRIEAYAERNHWVIKTIRHGKTRHQRLPLPDDLLFPRAMAERVRAMSTQASAQIVGSEFDIQSMTFESVRLTVQASRSGNPGQRWLRQTSQSTAVGGVFWHEASERFVRSLRIAGVQADRTPCPDACTSLGNTAPDLLDDLLRQAPYRIPRDFLTDPLRFALASRSGAVLGIPETDEQSVVVRGDRSIVTVCDDCGDEPPPDADTLHRYLQPNPWVQSDHPRILRMSRSARAGRGDVAARMQLLMRLVQVHMDGDIDMAAYADAVTAAESRSGDCTEFAVLLAALARARGIPTRVVAGMAYSARFTGRSHVFSPHAWVQAWTGERWQSFDAGLGQFDSGHIVVAIGDGRPDDYADVLNMLRNLDVVDAGRIAPETPRR